MSLVSKSCDNFVWADVFSFPWVSSYLARRVFVGQIEIMEENKDVGSFR